MLRSFWPWYERLFLLLLVVLIGWEAILAAHKLSQFPYTAVDFFQHDFLARFVNQGGSITQPDWPERMGAALGLHLPPSLERTAPYLLYLPIVLPIFQALALLPMSLAYALWLIANLCWISWVGAQAARALHRPMAPILFALALWPAMWHVLLLGNIDTLVWGFVNVGWIAFLNQWERWGGFWIGLAALMKGFPLFAALPWLVRKPFRTLQGLILGILVGGVWGALWAGIDGWRFLIQHLSDYRNALPVFMMANNSLLAMLWALMGPPIQTERGVIYHGLLAFRLPESSLYAMHLAASLLLVAVASIRIRPYRRSSPIIESGAWLCLGLLVWPVSWINYHIYLFMPLAALFTRRDQLSTFTRVVLQILVLPFTAALSYGFLTAITAPWMLVSIFLGSARIFLFWTFRRALSELEGGKKQCLL